ncbi:response regulator [Pseudomonas sp. ANT_H12B]|uniref:response regulator n=1 Tax=Pseudomonas sp. ANT_H12B TaxID=2597348 RepID=UPI0011EF4515|nr:response regulator [Pseudomonas sp. ANT_H12B]KAA0975698.1 response regulator [Pseudomonas sp. ANT_H12B]
MSLSILLVEDNNYKRQKIMDHIILFSSSIVIEEAHSFTSGSKKVLENNYGLVVLDIGLPTYDRVGAESGGRNRMFGGREIARKLLRRQSDSDILFITQYDAFSEGGLSLSLSELRALLMSECGDNFVDLIYYDGSKTIWKDQLTSALKKAEKKKT